MTDPIPPAGQPPAPREPESAEAAPEPVPPPTARASANAPAGPPKPPDYGRRDSDQIGAFLNVMLNPSLGCMELRVLDASFNRGRFVVPEPKYKSNLAGWFDSPDSLIAEAGSLYSVSAYVTVNPVLRDLLALSDNRLAKAKSTTTDEDIACLLNLFIDIDPKRKSGISSTDAELAAAVARRDVILDDFPEIRAAAIWGCSGNGTFIVARLVGYPNDPEHRQLIARAIDGLAARYSDSAVEIDPRTKNPSRVMALPGTWKCKGSHRPERPHRLATLDSPGRDLVPLDLRSILDRLPEPAPPASPAPIPASNGTASKSSRTAVGVPSALDRARAYLAKVDPAVSGDGGHDQAFKAACKMVEFGLDRETAFALLWNEFNPRCLPPWTEEELRHKVDDAFAKNAHNFGAKLRHGQDDADREAPAGSAELAGHRAPPSWVPVEPGAVLHCHDRPGEPANFGRVLIDMGDRAKLRFLEGEPHQRDVVIHKCHMTFPDGRSLEVEAAGNGADWPPLRLGELPPVEAFPLDVLPATVAGFVRVVSDAIGCPPDFVGLPVLVVAGAAIGRSVSLRLKHGYFASASLYGLNVGGPSSGKSPALDAVARPLWQIDEDLHETCRRLKAAFDEAMEAYNRAPKDEKPPRPTRPVIESAMLDDTTTEAVAPHLANNPRGLLVSRDEGSAWVASLNQYKNGRGSDRQFWLSALFGKPVRVDRKGNPDLEPIRIPHPFLSVLGNLPPSMLSELQEQKGRVDGFVERILFACPDPRPRSYWTDDGIPDGIAAGWAEVIRPLRARPMTVSEGKPQPLAIGFTDEAKAAWVAWYNAHVDEVNAPEYDSGELAVEGKLCDFAGRLVLILHLLHLSAEAMQGNADQVPPASRVAVEGAIRLWSYFRSHHRRVRWHMSGGVGNPVARDILDWARRNRKESFTVKELTDHLRWLGGLPDEPDTALCWLEGRHAVRRRPDTERPEGTRGRKPSPGYDLHPDLFPSQNSHNSRNSGDGTPGTEKREFCEFSEGGIGEYETRPASEGEETTWRY
jgi:hypothetical protein